MSDPDISQPSVMSSLAFSTFLEALRNTSRNIEAVVKDWERVEPELQMHYADELTMLIARAPSALEAAREHGSPDLLEFIMSITKEIVTRAAPLRKYGLNLSEVWAHVEASTSPNGADTNAGLPHP